MKILLLAFEGGEAGCMGLLAKRLKAAGHKVLIASADHFSVTHTPGEIARHYRSIGIADDEYANLDTVFAAVNRLPTSLPRDAVDWKFLDRFEKANCRRFTLLQLAAMDPLMLRLYHHRGFYHHPHNKNLYMKNLELHVRWLETIFDKGDFDIVFTVNFQYFIKALAFTMAEARNIPFLMVQSSRVADLYLAFDNYSLGTPRLLQDEIERLEAAGAPCNEAVAFMNQLRDAGVPAYTDVLITDSRLQRRLDYGSRAWEIVHYMVREPERVFTTHRHYRGIFRPNLFLPNYISVLGSMLVGLGREIGYFRRPQLVRTDLPDGPFVYFPLHLIPENAVLTLSQTLDEKECVFQLSKMLPPDWRIVVKVNPNMLMGPDTHPNRYYLEMNRLPNVQFINPLVSSAAILRRAAAVACVCGTALLEGAIYGLPGFRWGQTPFDAVDTVFKFEAARVREILTTKAVSKNVKYYVQACFNVGMRINQGVLLRGIGAPMTAAEREAEERQVDLLENAIYQYLAGIASRGFQEKSVARA